MDSGRTFPVSNVLKSLTSRSNDAKEANILDLNETVKLMVFYTAINGKNSTICYHDNLKKVQSFDTDDTRQLICNGAKMSSRKHRMSLNFICCHVLLLLNRVMRKPVFCICENKGADQLREAAR